MPAGLSAPARAALPAAGKRSLVPPRSRGAPRAAALLRKQGRAGQGGGAERERPSPRGHPSAAVLRKSLSRRAPCPRHRWLSGSAHRSPSPCRPQASAGVWGAARGWEAKPSPNWEGWEGRNGVLAPCTPAEPQQQQFCASRHPEVSGSAGAFSLHPWVLAAASPRCERQLQARLGAQGGCLHCHNQAGKAKPPGQQPARLSFLQGFFWGGSPARFGARQPILGLTNLFGALQPVLGSPTFLPHTHALCPTAPRQPHAPSSATVPAAAPRGLLPTSPPTPQRGSRPRAEGTGPTPSRSPPRWAPGWRGRARLAGSIVH